MKKNSAGETLKEICPTCGKRIAPNRRRGSLTSYLFGAFDCTCSSEGAVPVAQPFSDAATDRDESDFCPKCGLMIAAHTEEGSLTGFLFQDTRCKCPPDQAFADGKMSLRFRKMKQAGGGATFISSPAGEGQSSRMSIDLAPGATIGGAYTITKLIGRGGMGEVYLAKHETLGKQCALKVIPPEQVTEMGWQRFQLEAKAVAKLEHINLVRVTDLGIHDGCLPFYAMDYVEGKNLADLVSETGPMPLAACLDIFMQVCDGVDCAHRGGILHRDLKPANIMILPAKSGKIMAKVLDFGLAKLTGHDRSKQSMTAVGDIFGSPLYMSPEQCNGDKLDRRSDIYSLGCTMFECLTGRPPFAGNLAKTIMAGHVKSDPPSLESSVGTGKMPPSMEIIIAKLLRKNPVERYQTLLELRGDLEKVARGEDVEPFYVSRSKQWRDQPAASMSTTARKDLANQSPKISLGLGIAIVGMVAIIAGAGFVIADLLRKPHSPSQPSDSLNLEKSVVVELNPKDIANSPSKPTAPSSAKDTAPYSTIIEQSGRKFRVFDFPEDTVIGYIYDNGPNGRSMNATGRIKFPAEDPLSFVPYDIAIHYPAYLKRFRSGDIHALSMRGEDRHGSARGELKVGEYLEGVASIPGVQQLEIYSIYGDILTSRDIHSLDKINSLRILNVHVASIEASALAQSSIIKQLEKLDLQLDDDVTPILISLKNSPHLRELQFGTGKTTLDGIASVATLPQLQVLCLRAGNISYPTLMAKALEMLSKAPKLRDLLLYGDQITPDAIKALSSFKRLKNLFLYPSTDGAISLDTVQLSKISCLKQLEQLYSNVGNGTDATAIFRGLKGSTHMTELVLYGAKTSLEGVACAASLPRLKRLTIGSVTPKYPDSTVPSLKLLQRAPELHDLRINEFPITLDDLNVLKKFRGLRTFRCSQVMSGINNSKRDDLILAARRMGLTTMLQFD